MKKAEEFINVSKLSFKSKTLQIGIIEEWIKAAQIDAIEVTVLKCSQEAYMLYHDGHFKKDTPMRHIQVGIDNIQISKQSLIDIGEQLKKELDGI